MRTPALTGALSTSAPRREPQEAIKAKCFHPSGAFTEFRREDVDRSIPGRFEEIARRCPDRIAVEAGTDRLTYAELNALANRAARTILAQGGGRGKPIGLLLEKGALQIAAMLGVLKAGRFFVLIDPSFPAARIAAILDDSEAELVLTTRHAASSATEAASRGCRLIQLERTPDRIPDGNLDLIVPANALAFITYTSGSTGRPKGVLQNHRNILHDARLRTKGYHIGEMDRLSLLASGTSNAIKNAFLSLLNGAALLPFDVQKEGANRLAAWLSQERITICRISSPLFRKVCETLKKENPFPHVRLLLLASEAIYKSDIELYKRNFSPNCILQIGISSSEAGLMREYFIDHETDLTGKEVPVGYAVEGKETLLLDDNGRQIGLNEVGEIAVRSRYISPGYWRRPDLTKAKFKTEPNDRKSRVYLTGDLGLMLPDGCLVHKGRKDFRVKIRGYGVEVSEVETALQGHPAVAEAAVVTRPGESGEARLLAYLTVRTRPGPGVSELQRFLRQALPDYMIPSAFVMLESMPLSATGKIDRHALPEPGRARPRLDSPFVVPSTPIEKELAEIWTEVLSLDEVGTQDNFFDLGGHSLAAARVVSRIIPSFHVDLPVQSLFETPTIEAMGAVIERSLAEPLPDATLARMLTELESLSEEEAREIIDRGKRSQDR
jgi:amino acid adenylation domain-containing protein